MAWNDKLVTSSMLEDIFGIPAVSSLGANKFVTYDDIYNYQGDWNTDFPANSGNYKILTIDDFIYEDGVYNGWADMRDGGFNICYYDVDPYATAFNSSEQYNEKSPFDDLDTVTIKITYTTTSGTSYTFTINSTNCQSTNITTTVETSNVPQPNNVDVELSVVNVSASNTELRYQQLYFWEAFNSASGNYILEIYGNSTLYHFTFNNPYKLSEVIKYY